MERNAIDEDRLFTTVLAAALTGGCASSITDPIHMRAQHRWQEESGLRHIGAEAEGLQKDGSYVACVRTHDIRMSILYAVKFAQDGELGLKLFDRDESNQERPKPLDLGVLHPDLFVSNSLPAWSIVDNSIRVCARASKSVRPLSQHFDRKPSLQQR